MWKGNPALASVLFGLPFGFFALICYSICCADIMDAEEDDDEEEQTLAAASRSASGGKIRYSNHLKKHLPQAPRKERPVKSHDCPLCKKVFPYLSYTFINYRIEI